MQKVYIVTLGSYSDYRIDSVFSTEKAAKEQVELWYKAKPLSDAQYCEYILDEEKNAEVKYFWKVWFDLKEESFMHKPYEGKEVTKAKIEVFIWGNTLEVKSYISEEHAKKVAVEKHQLYLRLKNEGIPDEQIKEVLES